MPANPVKVAIKRMCDMDSAVTGLSEALLWVPVAQRLRGWVGQLIMLPLAVLDKHCSWSQQQQQ